MANYNCGSIKSKVSGPGAALRITPSNSPVLRPGTRSASKPALHQATLNLETVIGTTTTSPHGFSSHEPSRSFAFCAGSAAVLAELDSEGQVSQRFFRARPSATGVNPVISFYNPSTPPTTPDTRPRPFSSLKANALAGLHNVSPSGDWSEGTGGSSRSWTSKDRVKAVTSVAVSPNGRWLALGETGYNPRVLIFSTAKDSPPDVPLTVMTEHSFGVRALAFSSNSQYLATLGDMNDGFLFVWSVSLKTAAAKLHSTNKCTALVRDMCWMGQTLITVGLRHVKVWRLPEARPVSPSKPRLTIDGTTNFSSPGPKALTGRNCLLGSLGDCTFTCVASISDFEALLGTDTGALCLLDDHEGCQMLSLIEYVDFSITSMAVDPEEGCVWLGGRGHRIRRLTFGYLRDSVASTPSPTNSSSSSRSERTRCKGPAIACMGFLSTHLATIDAKRAIHIYPVEAPGLRPEKELSTISMPAHRDPVLGVGSLQPTKELDAAFFTWSSSGVVNFWDLRGRCTESRSVELEQVPGQDDDLANELKIVRTQQALGFFVSGDRMGVLRVLSRRPWKCVSQVRAHGGEITDIAIQPGPDICYVASSGRDRMVQLFAKRGDSFELIQTMDDHVGAVGQILFANDGERLLSCSADRTVIVRERLTRETPVGTVTAYALGKVIRLKASPAAMTLTPDDPDSLVLSTVDRFVLRYDLGSGRHIHSFRASDQETADAVVMGSLKVSAEVPGQCPRLLVGVSSTDKSLRIYDFERDMLLNKEFGHTEGVSDVLILEPSRAESKSPSHRTVITTGLDGVVMIWNLAIQPQSLPDSSQNNLRDSEETPTKELTVTKPPLRRILSKSELASFQRQDPPVATPTPVREQSPPLLRKKMSKYSLTPSTLKHESVIAVTPPAPAMPSRRSPTSNTPREQADRSPSPSSPKTKSGQERFVANSSLRRSSIDLRPSLKRASKSEFGSLNMSTEQVCRTLRAYRKKLTGSTDHLQATKELERELGLTLRILGVRSQKLEEAAAVAAAAAEIAETDTRSKESRRLLQVPSMSPKDVRGPRRAPSTPNLSLRVPARVSRTRSLDDAETGT